MKLVERVSNPAIYCDYCKMYGRKTTGEFSRQRPAVVKVNSPGWKGKAVTRYYCQECEFSVTHTGEIEYSLVDQMRDAWELNQRRLDV